MRKKKWRNLLLSLIAALAAVIFITDYWVIFSTKDQLYTDIHAIPENKTGLLLGTNKYVEGTSQVNRYYIYRIDAAVALFKAGKIKYILVSGDNSRKEYSEPDMMRADLMARGVPADRIYLDYAGFRTLDSIVRCVEIFGEYKVTIISQPFHNRRALFIAGHKGMQAIAYNAADVPGRYSIRVMVREKLARVKMLLDLVFDKQPKYLGKSITIG